MDGFQVQEWETENECLVDMGCSSQEIKKFWNWREVVV